MSHDLPYLGVGLGYRRELKSGIAVAADRIDFVELITEQYIDMPRLQQEEARHVARSFPAVFHGVDLSLGSAEFDTVHLEKVAALVCRLGPRWVSDHLCFTRVPGLGVGNLTPVSFDRTSARILARNIRRVAARLDCPFLVENISYYFTVPHAEMSEAEFITRVLGEADGWLLLDLMNVVNNAVNGGYDAYDFLDRIPLERVIEIHLAGSERLRGLLLDTHSQPVPADVFALLGHVVPRAPNLRGVVIERDQNFPPMAELLADLETARATLEADRRGAHHRSIAAQPLADASSQGGGW